MGDNSNGSGPVHSSTILPVHRSRDAQRHSESLDKDFEAALAALVNQKTPQTIVYQRQGRGSRNFDYVPGWWIINQLNGLFGFNWDWEILEQNIGKEQVWVKGKLTARVVHEDGQVFTVTKTSYGGSDVKKARETGLVIDLADDLKSASTDAMKKAASLLGIAADIYGGEDEGQNGVSAVPDSTLRTIIRRGGELGWTEEETKKWCSDEEGGIPFESIHPQKMNRLMGKLVQKVKEKPTTTT